MVALLVFLIATLEILEFLARKNCWTQKKVLFGDNGIKSPARCVYVLTQISRIKVLKSRSYSQKIKLNIRRSTQGVNYNRKTCNCN